MLLDSFDAQLLEILSEEEYTLEALLIVFKDVQKETIKNSLEKFIRNKVVDLYVRPIQLTEEYKYPWDDTFLESFFNSDQQERVQYASYNFFVTTFEAYTAMEINEAIWNRELILKL
ncbi:MAG: hypothetical protein KDC56_01435 [Flavobacteriaceae bacterium]|nr:hypothetical protein [Flavobacteriaceae bacterium]